MEKSPRGTGRRTLLQRALAVVAGGVALGSGMRLTRGSPVSAAEAEASFTVFAQKRPFAAPPNGRSTAPAALTASGELFDRPDGKAIGSFVTNCFCENTGGHNVVHAGLEFQALQLAEGTIYGMGAATTADGTRSHAVVGGTGRFAGARGVYIEQAATTQSGRDVIKFVVTLARSKEA